LVLLVGFRIHLLLGLLGIPVYAGVLYYLNQKNGPEKVVECESCGFEFKKKDSPNYSSG